MDLTQAFIWALIAGLSLIALAPVIAQALRARARRRARLGPPTHRADAVTKGYVDEAQR